MATRIPFRIDRTRPRALVRQMTDGLRDAIVTGYYKPGDMLPTIHEWTRALDVSIRVPEGALANLVKEGLVVTRPRQGCMVMPREGRRVWRGHVLLVRPVGIRSHFVAEQIAAAEEALSLVGYLATVVVARGSEQSGFDLSRLEQELGRGVNLAVVFGSQPQILECLAGTDVPFLYMDFGEGRKPGGKYAGYMEMSVDAALDEFVAHCIRAHVRDVAVVGKAEARSFAAPRLADAGIGVTRIAVKAARGLERVENLERETCRTLDRLFDEHGRGWLPDLMFVEDDYQAIGALFSLLSHGVRLPDDMRFAMTKNYGNGPALPQSITCVEFNPAASGAEIGRVAVEFLGGGTAAYERSTGYRYVIGDTFPEFNPTTKDKERRR